MNDKNIEFGELWYEYKHDWNRLAKEVFRVNLDKEQQEILRAVQDNKRVSARSGHARGKDFIAGVAANCFLYTYYPSKVICTAPTGRQVTSIMMAEVTKIHNQSIVNLPGIVLSNSIKIPNEPDWFLLGFKAGDKDATSWTGFHSPNIMVIATEASGLAQETFDAIEGLLTGNSKFFIVFNPTNKTGEAYKSTRSKYYKKFKLSCLNAPNVLAKKTVIPGQVDYDWVQERVDRWCTKITREEFSDEAHDFQFEGKLYRPNDLFRVKVLGEFASEDESQVIPLRWIELSNQRWEDTYREDASGTLSLGVDVAGMGSDLTVFTYRYGDLVKKQVSKDLPTERPEQIHMAISGKVKNELRTKHDRAYIDTIGEGAGVYSRLSEQHVENAVSVKFSQSAKHLTDITGERTFANMRAFCYWAIRDALDPKHDGALALPPDDELTEELTEVTIKGLRSDGSILLEAKDDIKKRIGRSPDKADSLAVTFYPFAKGGWGSLFASSEREGEKVL